MIAWMLYAIALSLLITGIARACTAVCALYRVPNRWCWVAALLLSATAPLAARSVPERVQRNTAILSAATYRVVETVSRAQRPVAAASRAAPVTLDGAVRVAWAAVSTGLLLTLLLASARLRRARRSWRRVMVCGEPVLISPDAGPAVAGLVHPQIVLPAWALELDHTELALAVMHEREHINARDQWLLIAAMLLVALAPWNPGLWLQLRQLHRAIEGDCDARVLARTRDALRYARLLITVGQHRSSARAPVLALSYPTSILEWRIRTMTNRTPSYRSARAAALTALVGALVAAATLLPRPGLSQSYTLARRSTASTAPVLARTNSDTLKGASDSALRATLAATRDTLARLRKQMESGVAAGALRPARVKGTVMVAIAQVPFRNTSASARAARAEVTRAWNTPKVPLATMQAAIASRFPDAASAVVAPGTERTFTFLVRADGSIESATVDTGPVIETRAFDTKLEPGQIESIQIMKKVPVGRDSVSVLWIVRK